MHIRQFDARRQIGAPALLTCLLACMAALTGCSGLPKSPAPVAEPGRTPTNAPPVVSKPAPKPADPAVPVLPPAGSGRGGYYLDDGPGDNPPEGLLATPDPEPKIEPYSPRGNRPYVVFGKTYTPITDDRPLKQRGVGSWYGKKFHGQKTSSGELYDMYKMTAAHPTLPIPSYARVTNLKNGAQVIVRVNDRGPFHSSRIIDLSYTAALKLGYLGKGSGELEVERLLPQEIERIAAENRSRPQASAVGVAAAASVVPKPAPPLPSPAPARSESTPSLSADNAELNAILAAFAQPAAAQPNAVATPAPITVTGGGDSFYLQLGAYGQAVNAEAARAQFEQSWSAKMPSLQVVQSGPVYRVYSGPFSSRADAAAAAQQLQDGGIVRPAIVQR